MELKIKSLILALALYSTVFCSTEVMGKDINSCAGYIREIDKEKGIAVIEEASYEWKNPKTGRTLELRFTPSTYLSIFPSIEEMKESEKNDTSHPYKIVDINGTKGFVWKGTYTDEKLEKRRVQIINEAAENFFKGDKVEVRYMEDLELSSITKVPESWQIWENGYSLTKEELENVGDI